MKVKKTQRPMETEMVKPVLNIKSKTKFKKEKTGKKKKGVASPSSTLTSELLSLNTPGARADRLVEAKARRAKKGKDPKGRPAVAEKKGIASPAKSTSAVVVPVVVDDEITRAKLEEAKAKRIAKKLRQKATKKNLATETGNGAGDGTAAAAAGKKTKKKKTSSLPVKIEALERKFSKQKEKIRLWKLNKKMLGKDVHTTTTTTTTTTAELAIVAKVAKEEKNRKRNLKKKQRLSKRKAEGVKIFKKKPRKGRTAATSVVGGMEVA